MKALRKHPFRVTFRFLWMVASLSWSMLGYLPNVRFARNISLRQARARWLQQTSRRLLRVIGLELQPHGPAPQKGLLVSNHLSYLDIMVLCSVTPVAFISKVEVRRWPVFGWFAILGGSLFVERGRRSDVARLNRELAQALDDGALVVLFPEGTSSDGSQILPFKSSLLEPVSALDHPVTVACVGYSLTDGDPGSEICYWGEMTLIPHLLNLFSKNRIGASVVYGRVERSAADRKELARELHAHIVRLKESRPSHTLTSGVP